MKKILFILFAGIGFALSAQSIDYNTKKNIAVDGYDVVSYFNNTAEEGNNTYVVTNDSVTYKFSSQENLNTFNSNPTKYIPQYGGYCAYAMAKNGKKVGVDPETFEIRNDKLYLFYNSWGNNTLKSWLKESPGDLVNKADENWETLKTKK